MGSDATVILVAFVMVGSLTLLVGMLLSGRKSSVDDRIDLLKGRGRPAASPETVAQIARTTLPKMGKVIVPDNEAERSRLAAQLIHAGLYHRQSMYVFLGVKLIILVSALFVGIVLTSTGAMSMMQAMLIALGLFVFGMIGPSFWLDSRKSKRQGILRRSLPDALDVLIICLEGGLSLQGGLKRVSDELRIAHPLLGHELRIVDREVQLGRSPGEALRHFAERTDLEEAVTLASVVAQSERFGASLVKSLRGYSEAARLRRKQKAEERAQKAATMILFPTLLFIFPAVFVVLLAPAVFQVLEIFGTDKKPENVRPTTPAVASSVSNAVEATVAPRVATP
ncbi:type II secretion system F family protein [Singulisphaera sp. PoT]|uniref:type II secretion system F family protein n=1 Tax=Singulisphaera sp. PoT TaxID=3411797 RepID=UPI003BF5FE0B